jgi:hypothetical protein
MEPRPFESSFDLGSDSKRLFVIDLSISDTRYSDNWDTSGIILSWLNYPV